MDILAHPNLKFCIKKTQSTVKSRFNECPPSAHFDSLNRDIMLNRDFLMRNFILVTRFCTLNRDFMLNRDSLNRDFTVIVFRVNFHLIRYFQKPLYSTYSKLKTLVW